MSLEWFILNPDHTVTKTGNFEEYAKLMADRDLKIVAQTVGAGDRFVSTVFLGIDHQWMDGGRPLIFETMIFEKGWLTKKRPPINWKRLKPRKQRPNERTDIHDWQDRYSTWDEAVIGHAHALGLLQAEFPGNLKANRQRREKLQAVVMRRMGEDRPIKPAPPGDWT